MNDIRLLSIFLGALVVVGIGVFVFYPKQLAKNGTVEKVAELTPSENGEATPTPTDEVPTEEEEEPTPDEAKVDQVRALELELSQLEKENPKSEEEGLKVANRTLELIDLLLKQHPTTSLRYAELLEDRYSTTNSLNMLTHATEAQRESGYKKNLELARDFVAKQPKLAIAHEVLGTILISSDDRATDGDPKAAFRECLKLEPTNGRCKKSLAALEGKPGLTRCRVIRADVGFFLGSKQSAPGMYVKTTVNGSNYYLTPAPLLDSRHIDELAMTRSKSGKNEINIIFSREGRDVLKKTTAKNVGKILPFGNGELFIASPVIREPLSTGNIRLTLGGSEDPREVFDKLCMRAD